MRSPVGPIVAFLVVGAVAALASGVWPLAPLARADEPPTSAAQCTGEPPAASVVASAAPGQEESAPTSSAAPVRRPRWRDLGLTAVVLAVGALGALVVRANEARRRDRARPAPPLDRSAYGAGAALGVVVAVSLVGFGHVLGASGGILELERGGAGWSAWIVVGVVLGGSLAALARRRFHVSTVPRGWQERFGPSRGRRWLVAFLAALLIEVAAAIAGGCTSGLALSGGVVLAPGAFVFMVAMFASGIPTAWLARRLAPRRSGS